MTDAIATIDGSYADDMLDSEIRSLRDNDLALVSTFAPDDKLAALAAISNSTPLSEQVNKTLNIANIIVQKVTITDDETGEISAAPRTVLVTDKGEAFHAVSKGILTSVRNILGIAGDPSTWPGALQVTPKTEGRAPRAYTTLKIGTFVTK